MAGKYLSAYYDGNNGNKIYLELHVYTIATSIANNTTTERADLYANVVDSSYQWYNGYGTEAFIGINGNNTTKTVTFDYRTNGVKNLISSWDTVVKHDNSGKASIGISAHHYSGVGLGNASVSGTYDCDTIQRYANFTTHSINSVTETKVIVTWGADAECDAIQYSLNNGTWTTISGYPNYTVSGLSPGTSYTIKTKIRRKDSQLWTESEALSFTTYSYPTQQFNNKSESYIVMNWSADSTVSEIYFSTNNGSTWSSKISVNATSGTYSIMNLSANTTYNVKTRIKRKNTNFYSDTSAITIKTYSYPTQTIKNVTETSVNVSWSADSTIDLLYYSTNNGSTWSEAISANAINGNYTISNLTPNTSYKIMTRFRRKENQSYSNSSSASIKTYYFPHCVGSSNFTIGDSVKLDFYNPLNREIEVRLKGNNDSTIGYWKGKGTSISGFDDEWSTNAQYSSIPNSPSAYYKIEVSYNGNVTTRNVNNTYAINRIKCIPIFNSFDIKDINSKTLALTGNNQIIVKRLSDVQIDIQVSQKAIAQNSATIVKYVVVSGDKTFEISYSDSNAVSTVIYSIQNVDVVVYAVDSRGLSSQLRQKVFDFRDWSEPVFDTAKVIRENGIGTKGLLDLKVNFWVGNFGTVENEIKKFSYKYKKRTSTSFSEYIDITDRMIRSEGNDYYINLDDAFLPTTHLGTTSTKFEVGYEYDLKFACVDKGDVAVYSDEITLNSGVPCTAKQKNSDGTYSIGINCLPDKDFALKINGGIKSSKAQLNVIEENKSEVVNTTNQYETLNSASVTTYGGDLLINAHANFYNTTAQYWLRAYIEIDGINKGFIFSTNSTNLYSKSGNLIVTNIAKGIHTISLKVYNSNGANQYCLKPAYTSSGFTVIEI